MTLCLIYEQCYIFCSLVSSLFLVDGVELTNSVVSRVIPESEATQENSIRADIVRKQNDVN